MGRARSWVELLEQLYEASWNAELRRFRSPFAFRGLADVTHILDNSLTRLAAGHPDVETLERAMLRNFRKYAAQQTASGVDSIWHWLAVAQHHGLPTRLVDRSEEHTSELQSQSNLVCRLLLEKKKKKKKKNKNRYTK